MAATSPKATDTVNSLLTLVRGEKYVPPALTTALDYAARGWLVLPLHTPTDRGCSCERSDCTSVGKHPRTRSGLKEASNDPAVIRDWWRRWPDANVGIATGPESGLFVLDVDGEKGESSLVALEKADGPLPDTYSVTTGGGGLHLYFLWPDGKSVRNSQSRIAPGLDIRGEGGYIVAPPSVHSSGARYELNESSLEPVPCPDALLSRVRESAASQPRQSTPTNVLQIAKGGRTDRLVSLAGTMHKRGMTSDAIEAALLTENLAQCSPPLPESKVRAIAHDIPARYPNPPNEPAPTLRPDLLRLADVEARPVDWLWKRYLALAMLAMLSGDPGAGKTFLVLAIAAGFTVGRTPDGEPCEPIIVLYLSIENSPKYTVRPRFDSLGGDSQRFYVLRGAAYTEDGEERQRSICLSDVSIIEAALKQTGAKLVIVDPIQSYLGGNVDLHRSNETRPVLDGLAKLAEKYHCCVVLVRHLSKQSGGKAIHRGLGSIDLSGAVRSEMLAGSLPDDPKARALVHIKSNLGAYGPTRGYSIDEDGRFSWTGESAITAADLLAAPEGAERSAVERAKSLLSTILESGSREQAEVSQLASAEGISMATLRRAKTALGIRSRKAAFGGGWFWFLPGEPKNGSETEHVQ